jgi:Na+/phosphate symporter
MNTRLKKLIGTALFAIGTAFFYFFVITVAIARLPGSAIGTHLLFYLIATLIWFVFAGILVRWMQKPAPDRRA